MSKKKYVSKQEPTPPQKPTAAEVSTGFDFNNMFSARQKAWFSSMSKIIYKDLNNSTRTQSFYQYSKNQIASFIKDPATNEQQLRDAVINLYNASSHFRRLIQYFVGLSDFSYVVVPTVFDDGDDLEKAKENYKKTVTLLSGMNIKAQCPEILTVCFREDTYFCTAWVTKDTISLQKLDSNYCKIASSEGNVFNVSFDFSYFDTYPEELPQYPPEFASKYSQYQKDSTQKWIDLDVPYSFAIKCNTDFPTYSVPPFVGILREVYDLEDYKGLKLSKTELENYALLVMKLAINNNGEWAMDFEKAKEFWSNLDNVLPEQLGSVLSPMPIDKIDFDRSGTTETDKITESESHLWAAAGVSSQMFASNNTSARSLEISGMSDQALTWGVVSHIGVAINRILQKQSFAKNYALLFLDTSRYNRDAMAKSLASTIQYGFPVVNMLMACMGAEPLQTMGLNYLEGKLLDLPNNLVLLRSSNTISAGNDAGRPETDDSEIADETERAREKV